MENIPLKKAIDIAGGQSALARRFSITPQAVQRWTKKRLPAEWVISVEKATGVSRHELRPDIYPQEQSQPPAQEQTLVLAGNDLSSAVSQF